MFTKRTTAALFAFAIASSLIVAGGLMGSAFAAKKSSKPDDNNYRTLSDGEDKASGPMPHVRDLGNSGSSANDNSGSSANDNSGSSANDKSGSSANDNSGSSAKDSSGVSSGDLKKLSKCESGAAEDGELTIAEVHNCYNQVFG
jgi:hypothetical protein